MTALPKHLPHTVEQLVEELDELNPSPVVAGPTVDGGDVQTLIFQAGRRSVIDELVRLLDETKES